MIIIHTFGMVSGEGGERARKEKVVEMREGRHLRGKDQQSRTTTMVLVGSPWPQRSAAA